MSCFSVGERWKSLIFQISICCGAAPEIGSESRINPIDGLRFQCLVRVSSNPGINLTTISCTDRKKEPWEDFPCIQIGGKQPFTHGLAV